MKLIKTFFLIALTFGIWSCTQKEDSAEQVKESEYIQISSMLTENFGDEASSETINYEYEKPDDIFWVKAVYKDGEGNETKTIKRELDENRLPVKEMVYELDMVTESSETKYDPDTKMLISVKDYQGELKPENLVKTIDYEYKDGVLFAQTINRYSTDSAFRNIDGNKITASYKLRYLPAAKHRPKGDYMTTHTLENMIVYETECCSTEEKAKSGDKKCCDKKESKVGRVKEKSVTEFNEEGYPVYFYTDTPECDHHASEEWYKIEKDGKGNVISVTGYMNKELDSSAFQNTMTTFAYDENGLVSKIGDYRYNKDDAKYDLMHSFEEFSWKSSGLDNEYQMYCPEKKSESYCFGSLHYTVTKKEVEIKEDTKVLTYYYFDMESKDGPKPELTDLKKNKVVTVKFKKIKK